MVSGQMRFLFPLRVRRDFMSSNSIKVSERDLREQIRDLCKLFGWRMYFSWTSLHSPRGFPDLVLVRDSVILAVELKSEKGKLTPEQEEWLLALSKAGVKTFIWRPSDWDNIVSTLQHDKAIIESAQKTLH